MIKLRGNISVTKNSKIIIISIALIIAITIITAFRIKAKKESNLKPVSSTDDVIEILPEDNDQTSTKDKDDMLQDDQEQVFVLPKEGLRPYAIMIDNEGTKSLPQGGLNKAQLIYEIIVEGGETRLMPVFWGVNPELIGPVRSSRHYFLDYSMEHDAIYVHFGWSPMAQNDISKFRINNINGVANGGEIFWDLTNDPNNWQDSYTSMKNILGYVGKAKYRTNTESKLLFKYNAEDTELENAEKAERVNIRYSSGYASGFEYDSKTKLYNRFRKEKPQMERTTDKQLTAKNIIIQRVRNYTIEGDPEGRQEVVTAGSGKGWFVTCGKAIEINWSKESRSSGTKYFTKDGKPITLNPGQTWIQITPIEGLVEIE